MSVSSRGREGERDREGKTEKESYVVCNLLLLCNSKWHIADVNAVATAVFSLFFLYFIGR